MYSFLLIAVQACCIFHSVWLYSFSYGGATFMNVDAHLLSDLHGHAAALNGLGFAPEKRRE